MGEVLPFRPVNRPSKTGKTKSKRQGGTKRRGLCQHGYHRWVIDQSRPFDSRKGRLVTSYHCERCGERKVTGE